MKKGPEFSTQGLVVSNVTRESYQSMMPEPVTDQARGIIIFCDDALCGVRLSIRLGITSPCTVSYRAETDFATGIRTHCPCHERTRKRPATFTAGRFPRSSIYVLLCDLPSTVLHIDEQFVIGKGKNLLELEHLTIDRQTNADGRRSAGPNLCIHTLIELLL